MPYLVYHIDEIGRRKKRNVIVLRFNRAEATSLEKHRKNIEPKRKMIIEWLSKRKIKWQPCYDVFSGHIELPYDGHIYIDLSVDKKDHTYLELCKLLENEDETPKFKGVGLWILRYSDAKKNGKFYKAAMDSCV